MKVFKLLFILVLILCIPLFAQSLHYYFYETQIASQVYLKWLIVTDRELSLDGEGLLSQFKEINASEAKEMGYEPIEDSLLVPPYGYNSYIKGKYIGDWKYVRMWSASSSQNPTLMYLWATSKWRELGSPYWNWSCDYKEIFGTYLESYVEFQYPRTITAELEQKGVHTFWVGPNPPPPPAPRGACLGVEPHLPPEPYDFGKDGWETYYSYYYTIF